MRPRRLRRHPPSPAGHAAPAATGGPSDLRPGVEDSARRGVLSGWARLPRSEVIFGLTIGLMLSVVLVAFLPSVRTHMLGGTDERTMTVTDVSVTTKDGDSDRFVTEYVLRWTESGSTSSTTFTRSGPPRRAVGNTWQLWVSPDGATVTDSSPLATWLWLGLAIPGFSLLLGWLWQWRSKVLCRALARDIEAHTPGQDTRG